MIEREVPVITVISLVEGRWLSRVTEELPGVRVVHVPANATPDSGLHGEVLVANAVDHPQLRDVVQRGVRWIHLLGTGIDQFPLEVVEDRTLTCSRGASAEPIAEWIVAIVLAAAKNLPDAWVHEAPSRWATDSSIGTLRGSRIAILGIGSIGMEAGQKMVGLVDTAAGY